MKDLKKIQEFFSKPLEEGKQLDNTDFTKVVKAVEQTGHPVTVLLVPKFNEIEILTGMDAPDDMIRDLSNAVDSLEYGRNDIIIAADSSNLSRREYSDIFRVNGGHKDYFEESYASSFGGFRKELDGETIENELQAKGYETPRTGIWNKILVNKNGERVAMIDTDESSYTKDGKSYQWKGTSDFISHVESVNEMDINDPILMKMRAAKDAIKNKKPDFGKEYGDAVKTAYGNDKNAKKLAFLKKERAQLMRDMEQEAEPEGGPIADEYGSKLNRIDKAIAKLSGRKEMTYDQAIAEAKVDYDFSERELIRVLRQLKRGASTEIDMIKAFEKALGREITDKELFSEAIAEASKGAKNYFDDLKYYYQKAFRYLESDEKKEYQRLAKNYFSSLKESINEYDVYMPSQDQVDKFFALTNNETHYLNSKPVMGQEGTFNLMPIEPWDEYDYSNWKALVRKAKQQGKSIDENDSYVRVSEPKFVKDKNNPNFLYVNFKYDTGPGGASIAFGKETMSGQIRRLSSAEAMKQATALAKDLEAKYNLEDIDVYDKENGVVQIFAVSDDFIDMNPNMLGEATRKESIAQTLAETIKLGEGVIEEELCPKGKAYIKRRKAAGEKSSAYLSGRAVKVCKGQMSGRKKKK